MEGLGWEAGAAEPAATEIPVGEGEAAEAEGRVREARGAERGRTKTVEIQHPSRITDAMRICVRATPRSRNSEQGPQTPEGPTQPEDTALCCPLPAGCYIRRCAAVRIA